MKSKKRYTIFNDIAKNKIRQFRMRDDEKASGERLTNTIRIGAENEKD